MLTSGWARFAHFPLDGHSVLCHSSLWWFEIHIIILIFWTITTLPLSFIYFIDLYRYFMRYKKMESFYESLRKRIVKWTPNKKAAYNKGCWQWDRPRKGGSSYGTCNLYLPGGDQMRVNAHRASNISNNQRFILPCDISHLCHESKCVHGPDHLSHETHAINMDRDREICRKAGRWMHRPLS